MKSNLVTDVSILVDENETLRKENMLLKSKVDELSENIKLVGRQNRRFKKDNERYRCRLEELLYNKS